MISVKKNYVMFSPRPFLIDNKLRWNWFNGKVYRDKIIINSSLDRNLPTLSNFPSFMVGMDPKVENPKRKHAVQVTKHTERTNILGTPC